MYDYAIVQTTQNLAVETMRIAVIQRWGTVRDILKKRRPYMFFSAYDDRDIPSVLRLRNCRMNKVTSRMIYSKCDTVAETAGAGVYLNVRSRNEVYQSGKKVANYIILNLNLLCMSWAPIIRYNYTRKNLIYLISCLNRLLSWPNKSMLISWYHA